MKAFDVEGKEIEVFSQEELDAKIEEERQKAIADAEKAKADADAKGNDDDKKDDEMPEWAKKLSEQVTSLKSNSVRGHLDTVVAGLDADKRKEVETAFEKLTGYEETPEGLAKKSADAYLLATGMKYEVGSVDMGNIIASGNGKTNFNTKVDTEVDKGIQSVLGITSADVEKYKK